MDLFHQLDTLYAGQRGDRSKLGWRDLNRNRIREFAKVRSHAQVRRNEGRPRFEIRMLAFELRLISPGAWGFEIDLSSRYALCQPLMRCDRLAFKLDDHRYGTRRT